MRGAPSNSSGFNLSSLRCAAGTDVGLRRDENQDSFGVIKEEGFQGYFVADGMGGAQGGATASRMAIAGLQEALSSPAFRPAPAQLVEVIERINKDIFERGISSPGFAGMGTTLVGLVFTPECLLGVNVGDSRAYRIRQGVIEQISEDHTLVKELVRAGSITAEEAEHHPVSHMLTRSLGPVVSVQVECRILPEPPQFGDIYILCSDGLYNCISDQDMLSVVTQNPLDDANQILINLANQRGGSDNITVLVIAVGERVARTRAAVSEVSVLDSDLPVQPAEHGSSGSVDETPDQQDVIPPPVQEPKERRSAKRSGSTSEAHVGSRGLRPHMALLLASALVVGLVIGNLVRQFVPGTNRDRLALEWDGSQQSLPRKDARGAKVGGNIESDRAADPARTSEEILRSIKELNEKLESLSSAGASHWSRVSSQTEGGVEATRKLIESHLEQVAIASREAALWGVRVRALQQGAPDQVRSEQRKVAAYSVAARSAWDKITELNLRLTRLHDEKALTPQEAHFEGEIHRFEQELSAAEREFTEQVLAFAKTKQAESLKQLDSLTKELEGLKQQAQVLDQHTERSASLTDSPSSNNSRPLKAILEQGFPPPLSEGQ